MPKVSMKTKLSYADTLTGVRTLVSYVQSIPALKALKEGKAYCALDLDEERMEKGVSKAESIDMVVLFDHAQHKALKTIVDGGEEKYWFVEYNDASAQTSGSPLVQYFKATIDMTNDAIEIDDFYKDTVRFYKSTDISESDGYPSSSI